MDAYLSCCIVIADEYHGRLFELLDSYSPTNTLDAHSSCCIVIADEYHGRLLELLDSYSPTNTMDAYSNTADAHSSCWTLIPSHSRTPWQAVTSHLPFAELD